MVWDGSMSKTKGDRDEEGENDPLTQICRSEAAFCQVVALSKPDMLVEFDIIALFG
jgi:hypothetical protein